MKNVSKKINDAGLALYLKGKTAARHAAGKLRERNGSFFTDHALAIVIVVVIAGIVLLAVVALFKDQIFPNLTSKTDEFFAIT